MGSEKQDEFCREFLSGIRTHEAKCPHVSTPTGSFKGADSWPLFIRHIQWAGVGQLFICGELSLPFSVPLAEASHIEWEHPSSLVMFLPSALIVCLPRQKLLANTMNH